MSFTSESLLAIFENRKEVAEELRSVGNSLLIGYDESSFSNLFEEFMSGSGSKTFCDPRFNLKNFPINRYFLNQIMKVNIDVFNFGMTSVGFNKAKTLEFGCRPAMPIELLAFVMNASKLERNFMLASLDPLYKDSNGGLFFSFYQQVDDRKKIGLVSQKTGLLEHSFVLGIKL